MTTAACLHNAVPVKRMFRKKWMCIRCGEIWALDPTVIHANTRKLQWIAETLNETNDNFFYAEHGKYLIQEEP